MRKLNAQLKITELAFSNGTRIDASNISLILLVGPNNSGKSECLRDIAKLAEGPGSTVVLTEAQFAKTGNVATIREYLTDRFQTQEQNGNTLISFFNKQIWQQSVQPQWEHHLGVLAELFVSRLTTDERLSSSNPVSAVRLRDGLATHPFHFLQDDTDLETRVSRHFKRAFGEDLIVDRFGGSHVGLLVGCAVPRNTDEDRISRSYRIRLDETTQPLEKQGDGMRAFATVVSKILAMDTASVILVDEPEAFLYPPQARMLGEFLATEIPEGKQVVAATHSRDFLTGVLSRRSTEGSTLAVVSGRGSGSSGSSGERQIIRLSRKGNVNYPSSLDQTLAAEISNDAVMRHSAILDGVFHERVMLCEADADCMFYNEMLRAVMTGDSRIPDVFFVQSGGKQRMPKILKSLRALGVRTDVVVDIDVLNDENLFKTLLASAGGRWEVVSAAYKQVLDAVKSIVSVTCYRDLMDYFGKEIEGEESSGRIAGRHKAAINNIIIEASSGWGRMKKAGCRELPSGEPTKAFERVVTYCKSVHIWVVKVGELEGFCKTADGKGQRWAQDVLANRDLATDAELTEARGFIREIWERQQ